MKQTFNTLDLDLQYEFTLGTWNNLTTGLGYRHIDGNFCRYLSGTLPDQNKIFTAPFFRIRSTWSTGSSG